MAETVPQFNLDPRTLDPRTEVTRIAICEESGGDSTKLPAMTPGELLAVLGILDDIKSKQPFEPATSKHPDEIVQVSR